MAEKENNDIEAQQPASLSPRSPLSPVNEESEGFGVNKPQGKGNNRSQTNAEAMLSDRLKSVRSAREKLDLEPTRQNSHACDVHLVAKLMETDVTLGLTQVEADSRIATFGMNKLAEAKPETLWELIWRQINQVLIWIMLIAAIVSAAVESWPECGLILGVVVINVVLSVLQEGKASKATAALKNMLSTTANVIRDGKRMEINAELVVPGDIVFVESGNKVPADVRLFNVSNLAVQEAMLTGESLPVNKVTKKVVLNCGLGDRKNMCYSATLVVKGQGMGICVATGDTTEIGRIAELVSEVTETKTNLLKQIDAFGRFIGFVVLPFAIITFLIAFFSPVTISDTGPDTDVSNGTDSGDKAKQSLVIAVAAAVSLIPAGLPAVVTVCLAVATTYMAKNHAIVKTLPSVETLGSVMVICSDKTGTLTKNEMTVVAARTLKNTYNVTGVGYDSTGGAVQTGNGSSPLDDPAFRAIVRGGVLNNESRIERTTDELNREIMVPIGDPSECALACFAEKSAMEIAPILAAHKRVGIIPFESEHKFMITFHADPAEQGKYLVIAKGAPDRLAAQSVRMLDAEGREVDFDAQFWKDEVANLSAHGYRCFAICQTSVLAPMLPEILSKGADWLSRADAPILTFVGLLAILDPPREECIVAIQEAHRAGIIVKMITGDHPSTAKAIGEQLGIVDANHQTVLTGPELDKMSTEELGKVVVGCNIFARASPDNKISIVRALQNQKMVCSMTGDGVNDAPALRAADIGVAMGITGSDVSKDAAKIILTDDNFATILVAVKEGRRVWDNLRKVLLFNMPANFSQGGVIFIAVCLQWSVVPLTAIQVLYVNLISSCTLGVILVFEPAEKTVMDRPPRRLDKGLMGSLFYWRNIYVSTIFITFILGSVSWIEAIDREKYDALAQRSIAFNTMTFCQIFYAFNCRFLKLASIHPRVFRGNPGAWWCALLMAGLNVLVTYVPGLNGFFSMSAMDGVQWGIVLLFAVCSFLIVEMEKALTDPLKPCTRPIVVALKRFFGSIPSCTKLCGICRCDRSDQHAKNVKAIDPKTRQGGSMRAVPEEILAQIKDEAENNGLIKDETEHSVRSQNSNNPQSPLS